MGIETVALSAPPDRMTGYAAAPSGDGPWPGVVVVHDALGPTTDLIHQVEWLAGEGFLAVAPDLYWRGGRLRCLFDTMRAVARGEGPVFDDLTTTREWLRRQEDCTGRVGLVGFCMGGGIALAVAPAGGWDAANANYGMVASPTAADFEGACPILATFGGRDRSLRSAPDDLRAALTGADVEHEVVVYPDAGHGFLNDHVPEETPLWARLAGPLVVTEFHPDAATDARDRIVGFLADRLGS